MTTALPTQSSPPHERPTTEEAGTRTLRSDIAWLRSQVLAAIDAQPLAAAATAAAIGFVLGGGLTPGTVGLLIQTGSRVAANRLGAALQPEGPEDFDVAEGSAHE